VCFAAEVHRARLAPVELNLAVAVGRVGSATGWLPRAPRTRTV
jgi:hypothetical protein